MSTRLLSGCGTVETMADTTRWEQLWLPLWPLSSDDLRTGIYRGSRQTALKRRYIEANPQALSNLLVVDIDQEDALLRSIWDRDRWRPNAVVENPANGHAHAVWALKEPITRTEYARHKPLAYAAAITEGLRRSVDGDKSYSGLITKNPEHDTWNATWWTDELYSLQQLDEHLTDHGFMPPRSWRRTRRKNPVGLGRNCFIFETARTWAYREARKIRLRHEYPTVDDAVQLHDVLSAHVHELNADFREPLPGNEAQQIANSIHKWITTRFYGWKDSLTVNQATFTNIQAARGKRSAASRLAKQKALIEKAINDDN